MLTAHGRKVLRVIICPAPDDPEYASWWKARLVSSQTCRWMSSDIALLRSQRAAMASSSGCCHVMRAG